jgi:ATP-dependent RNA helicase DeaD
LAERNYTELTPVQAGVLTEAAVGRDLLVSAQTGSGKTVAYGLAIANDLLGTAERFTRGAKPAALIVAPTRELAMQVQRELTWLYQYSGARIVSCVGGMDPRREQRELADGAHIVVGTPGRLCDHLRRNRLDVSELKAAVLDEADEMLDLGFREDLEFILKTTPAERRTLLFSATLPRGIVALAKQYQKDAHRIEVAGGERGHVDIEYRAIRVAPADVEHAVVNMLRFFESPGALVFCNTRNAVNHLQAALLERGFSVVALSGELSQGERTHALQALRDGRARVCVATDVAARGIDLPNLGLVIHADLPNDAETLQHRSGRTGRAGRKGVSVMLVPPSRRRKAEIMLRQAGVDAVWGTTPQAEEIRKLDQRRMLQDPLFTEEASEDDLALARAMMAERSGEAIAAALARLYRARLPAPEDILDPGQDRYRDRFAERGNSRDSGGDDFEQAPRKPRSPRREMSGGSMWFRVSAGRQKKAEARWLLPMICRRGGIEKNDIGAIRIYEHHSEFEISAEAAEKFQAKIKRPDKEQHVIAQLPGGPQGELQAYAAPARLVDHAAGQSKPYEGKPYEGKRHETKPGEAKPQDAKPFERKPFERKPYEGKARHGDKPRYDKKRPFGKKHKHDDNPAFGGKPRRADAAPFAKPDFAEAAKGPKGPKKLKKNKKAKHRQNPMIANSSGDRG